MISYKPMPQTPLSFSTQVTSSWAGAVMSRAEALWADNGGHRMECYETGRSRHDSLLGCGLLVGDRPLSTRRVGFTPRRSTDGTTYGSATR